MKIFNCYQNSCRDICKLLHFAICQVTSPSSSPAAKSLRLSFRSSWDVEKSFPVAAWQKQLANMEQLEQILVCQATICLTTIFIPKKGSVFMLHQLLAWNVLFGIWCHLCFFSFVSRVPPKRTKKRSLKGIWKECNESYESNLSLFSVHLKNTKIHSCWCWMTWMCWNMIHFLLPAFLPYCIHIQHMICTM